MNKNNLQKEYQKINMPKELEEKILAETINNPKETRKFNLVYASWISLIVVLCSITIVYADEIREFFKWTTYLDLDDGTKVEIANNNTFKKINPDFLKLINNSSETDSIQISQLDTILGFHILNSHASTLQKTYYDLGFNKDGTLGIINLWYPNFIGYNEEKRVSMYVRIINENADDGYVSAFEGGIDASGNKKILRNYKSEKLNTNIIIYTNDWDSTRLSATFVYDNVFYHLSCNGLSIDELIEIVNDLC